MAHALMLTASSSGRAPVPTGDGSTLLVDDANAVMITVAPNPSSWDPEELTLFRGGQRVATPPMSDGTRWVLMGDDRFGTFQARATAAGTPVESPAVRVVPATVSLRATPPAAAPPLRPRPRARPRRSSAAPSPPYPPAGPPPPARPLRRRPRAHPPRNLATAPRGCTLTTQPRPCSSQLSRSLRQFRLLTSAGSCVPPPPWPRTVQRRQATAPTPVATPVTGPPPAVAPPGAEPALAPAPDG